MQNVAVDTQYMRGINASAVLGVLRDADSLSVAEVADRTGLSRQAVTRALAGLEGSGLVRFRAPDPSAVRSGRPAQSVEFDPRAGYILGVSVTPASVSVALADLRGAFVARTTRELRPETAVLDAMVAAASAVLSEAGAEPSDVWAACVGVPGIVDTATGEVKLSSSMAAIHGSGLTDGFSAFLGAHVAVDNDVKLATEGEQWRGAPHVLSSLVLVEWGERVGAGLLLNGSLYRGASNDSGDLGFLDLSVGGHRFPTESTDGLGPFERLVGGSGLVAATRAYADAAGDRDLVAELGDPAASGLEVVIDAVLADRPAALDALRDVAATFARGVSVIRALLDPQLVIIGGPMARAGDRLLTEIRSALAGEVLNQPPLELSALGGDAVVHGAVHHALATVASGRLAAEALSESMSTPAR
jgi:predicted NBD/HSP70 family sugar kinase